MKKVKVLLVTLAMGLGMSTAIAKHHNEKGPCAEIKCEKGDKFCYDKKKECKSKEFKKKLDHAKKKGITEAEKAEWTAAIEKKIEMKKEKKAMIEAAIPEMEANLKEVQALKAKKK